MRVRGLIWAGTSVDDVDSSTDFFARHLGMNVESQVQGFSRLVAENGDRLELFGPDSNEHDQLDTGPVAGFWVDDAGEAHEELSDRDVPGLSDLQRGPDGHRWFYFKGPDGNYYEICENPAPRPPRSAG